MTKDMQVITQAEFIRQVIEALTNGDADIQTDNEGQLVIYTGIFEQVDTTLSDTPAVRYWRYQGV